MFGPLHQRVELLLASELELGLHVCLLAGAGLVQLELVAHPLCLEDPLGGHVARSEVTVLSLVLGLLPALACNKLLLNKTNYSMFGLAQNLERVVSNVCTGVRVNPSSMNN